MADKNVLTAEERRERDLQALIDKQALYELAVRYARAIDRRDRNLLLSVYHDDAVDEHGTMFTGGPVAFADWQPEVMKRFEITTHYIMNTAYRLDGDRAEGELHFIAYHRTTDEPPEDLYVGGRYLDRYERRRGEWRIAHRTLVWDFTRGEPTRPERMDFLRSLGRLGAGANDPSFSLLPLFGRAPEAP